MRDREHSTRDSTPETAVERGLTRLAGLARDAGSRDVPEAWRERVLGALEREARTSLSGQVNSAPAVVRASRARGRSAVRVIALVAACLAMVLAIGGAFVRFRPEAPLAYAVDDAASPSRYVRAGPAGAIARFGDGTVLGFAPGARGRIVDVTPRGARVSVDEGKVHFAVVHRPGAEWTVEAGPFTIAVTGTEFDVDWEHEHLDLVVQVGTVIVRGPLTPQGVALHGGQHLAADVARGELTIVESQLLPGASATASPLEPSTAPAPDVPPHATADPAPEPSPKRSPSAPPAPHPPATTSEPAAAPAPTERQAPAPPSFRDRVARGDFAAVISEAEARGIDTVMDTSSLADIAALADAARYAGRSDLAHRALLAERSRFPGSPEARSAAFLLGRMAETSSPSIAVTYYDTYLTESPDGALASEALGRKMLAVKATSGARDSRPIAREYLRLYPRGAFSEAAEEILASP